MLHMDPLPGRQVMETSEQAIAEHAGQIAHVIRSTAVDPSPFPHLQMQPLLPAPLYDSLIEIDIAKEAMQGAPYGVAGTESERNRLSLVYTGADLREGRVSEPAFANAYRILGHSLVRDAFFAVFGSELAGKYGRSPLRLDTSFTYVEDSTGYELLPHTDSHSKAITLLIYLPRPGDDATLGTCLYRPKDERLYYAEYPSQARHRIEQFHPVCTVPFRANQAVAFAPSKRTFHGVPPVHQGDRTRRLIQFQIIAEPAGAPASPA